MSRLSIFGKFSWLCLLGLLLAYCPGLVLAKSAKPEAETPQKNLPTHRVELSQPPFIPPDTLPVRQNIGGGSSLSVDTGANMPDYMRYEPYNTYPRELDLWNLEGKRIIRSLPVVSPDKQFFAYTEVLFMPNTRQTISSLYLTPVPPLPAPVTGRTPSEEVKYPVASVEPAFYGNRFNPDKNIKARQTLLSVGHQKIIPFAFQTLTVVDWSENGQRLLLKQRSGVLHIGLRTSDILIYAKDRGTVTIYPEIHRTIENYWSQQGLPNIEQLAWDIQPLGWEPDSNQIILLKAWAYDKREKKFLGLWQYDVDAQRTRLLSVNDMSATVAANGLLATPVPFPPKPDPTLLHRMFRHGKPKTEH